MQRHLAGALLVVAVGGLASCAGPPVYTGVITDDVCGAAGHAGMQMGPTDAECTRLCVLAHGAAYVLLDGDTVYGLSDQAAAETLAGQRVSVEGTLDASTNAIQVSAMVPLEE